MPFICVICIENLTPSPDDIHSYGASEDTEIMVTTLCGHLFHKSCLIRGFEVASARRLEEPGRRDNRHVCPTCNTPVDVEKLVRIYPSEVDDDLIEKLIEEVNELKQKLKKLTEEKDKKPTPSKTNEKAEPVKPFNQAGAKPEIMFPKPEVKRSAISERINEYLRNTTSNEGSKSPSDPTPSIQRRRNFLFPEKVSHTDTNTPTPNKTFSVSINGKKVREGALIGMLHKSPNGDSTEELGTIKKILDVKNQVHFAILMENPVGNFSGVHEGKVLFECSLDCGMLVPVLDFIRSDTTYKLLDD